MIYLNVAGLGSRKNMRDLAHGFLGEICTYLHADPAAQHPITPNEYDLLHGLARDLSDV